ncbi:MAG: DUF924 domain-containing protein [Pigmentiphaga sp.]|nr:DUF924 domain-containing protein [Pigmentiphaga sp.]
MSTTAMNADTILRFWFEECTPEQWWTKSADFDRMIASRFAATLEAAGRCELFSWRGSALGRLAEIIVLDQFSRNVYRDTPRAFANDALALGLSQTALALGADQAVDTVKRPFFYMPYMHSESLLIHDEALKLFRQPSMEDNLDFEIRHRDIIERFGHYPHRNAILGRVSTNEEIEFLKTPGSSF